MPDPAGKRDEPAVHPESQRARAAGAGNTGETILTVRRKRIWQQRHDMPRITFRPLIRHLIDVSASSMPALKLNEFAGDSTSGTAAEAKAES